MGSSLLFEGRLREYAAAGVGLVRGEVRLLPHQVRWKRVFSDEAHLVYDQLRLETLRLYHVGSTAIPGISAKPVIDMVGAVLSLAALEARRAELEAIGYEWKGEYGIPGRRYCVLYDRDRKEAFAHLHFFEHGHEEVARHVLFRDALRANASLAQEYVREKERLLAEGVPRAAYSEAKQGVISKLMSAAQAWRQEPAKVLAILGSAPGGGNTRAFLQEQFGGPGLEIVELHQLRIAPYLYGSAGDALEDDFGALVQRMLDAEQVVLATPVYWYAMSGAMKAFFDRFSNLLRGRLKPLGEALNGKKISLLVTGSDARLPQGFEVPVASTALYLAMDYLGARYRQFHA